MAPRSSAILDELQIVVGGIFEDAQLSLGNHKKNCVALYKRHSQASNITQTTKNGDLEILIGERVFADIFIGMVNRVLVIKKGPAAADRIVKFVGAYVKFLNKKAEATKTSQSTNPVEDETEDTFASRFVSRILNWLFQGFTAKNKVVRYRSLYITSEMISYVGEIEEDIYETLRESLMDRIYDKEPLIRAHAAVALSKLVGSEDPTEMIQGEKTILEVLLDLISYDIAAEVRRAAILNVPLVMDTLNTILDRTRDIDPIIRKLVYTTILKTKLKHPRQLTISQREAVVKNGLGDREPAVRVAAGKLVASWFDCILADGNKSDDEFEWEGDDGGIMKGLVRFLSLFDVVGPGETIAVDAITSIFITRPEIIEIFVFSNDFWEDMSPECAVLARVFVEHCVSIGREANLEAAALPVVTAFAFHIQEAYNALLQKLKEAEELEPTCVDDDEAEQLEEEVAKRELILSELLRTSLKLDYMDEIGRRKVSSVIRDMLAHPQLPPGLIDGGVDLLKKIMPSERDLIRVIVEIIIELRDDGIIENSSRHVLQDEDTLSDITQTTVSQERSLRRAKERHQMSAVEAAEADVIDLRCLLLCISMLQRVDSNFEDNSTLEGILVDLIVPCVKRKELILRGKALTCLGLCCLIARNMALSSFQLFVSQVQNSPEELKTQALRVVFDLLLMYDRDFLGKSSDTANKFIEFFLHAAETEESSAAQAILCIGLCKLLLAGLVQDSRVLVVLILSYVSPVTSDNQEVRQCLSYFFPVYCYSSSENQCRMQSVFMTVFDLFKKMYEERDEDQNLFTPYQFGVLMTDWTNPEKLAASSVSVNQSQESHARLAIDILCALYDSERTDDDKKIFCKLLEQLNIVRPLGYIYISKINILISHYNECPCDDVSLRKALDRFAKRFHEKFTEDLSLAHQIQLDAETIEMFTNIGLDVVSGEDNNTIEKTSSRDNSRTMVEESFATSRTESDQPDGTVSDNSSSSGSFNQAGTTTKEKIKRARSLSSTERSRRTRYRGAW